MKNLAKLLAFDTKLNTGASMISSSIKGILRFLVRNRKNIKHNNLYEQYQYLTKDGKFDYEKYKSVQVAGNKKKLGNTFAQEENIEFLSEYIRKKLNKIDFGICHGTRMGKEQAWFIKHLGCNVIGTEISDSAKDFPNTIEWDFHDVKEEWISSVDFIYSNAFDHSYDPKKCINAWMDCIRDGGLCIIEHTSAHEAAVELDPFGAHISVMPYLVLEWGEGKFSVREIIRAPKRPETLTYSYFLMIQKN